MESLRRYEIVDDATYRADDAALGGLFRRVYVGGGFTEASVAELVFKTDAVRARGQVLCARDVDGALLGMVIVVPPTSPARVLAGPNEAEMHLLAVDEASRGHGLGRALVRAALDAARRAGCQGMVLWTQTAMGVAQQLYEREGFLRSASEDFERNGRSFLVYRRAL